MTKGRLGASKSTEFASVTGAGGGGGGKGVDLRVRLKWVRGSFF